MNVFRKLLPALALICVAHAQASVEITSFTVNERDGTVNAMATLRTNEFAPPETIPDYTVDYQTVDGTAQDENGSGDYVGTMGQLIFTEFDVAQPIPIDITQDIEVEPDENFFVELFLVGFVEGPAGEPDATGTITIEDDDLELEADVMFTDGNMAEVNITLTCNNGNVDPPPLGNLSATKMTTGQAAIFTVANYLPGLDCDAVQTDPPPAGYTQVATDCNPGLDPADPVCEITNELNTDTIRVQKVYTEGPYVPVTVTINCDSGNVDGTGTTTNSKQTGGDGFASFNITGFNQASDASGMDTNCVITESDVPVGYFQQSAVGCEQTLAHQDNSELCVFTNAQHLTRFEVSKVFDDGNPAEVEVTISCNTGLPLEQVTSISEGNGVTFIVDDFEDGAMDCDISEVVPDGYAADYAASGDSTGDQDENGCHFSNVGAGHLNVCAITNLLQPVDITVNKEWIDEHPEFELPTFVEITIFCNVPVFGALESGVDQAAGDAALFYRQAYIDPANPGEFFLFPHFDGSTFCFVEEEVGAGVLPDTSDCENIELAPGVDGECTIVNTRLFAGIPTLSQYGLILMALVLLGVGLAGFRRFA